MPRPPLTLPTCGGGRGGGLGFERTLAYVAGLANVRDAIPFRRTPGNARYEATASVQATRTLPLSIPVALRGVDSECERDAARVAQPRRMIK